MPQGSYRAFDRTPPRLQTCVLIEYEMYQLRNWVGGVCSQNIVRLSTFLSAISFNLSPSVNSVLIFGPNKTLITDWKSYSTREMRKSHAIMISFNLNIVTLHRLFAVHSRVVATLRRQKLAYNGLTKNTLKWKHDIIIIGTNVMLVTCKFKLKFLCIFPKMETSWCL